MYNQAHDIHVHTMTGPVIRVYMQVHKPGPRLTLLPHQSISMCEGGEPGD